MMPKIRSSLAMAIAIGAVGFLSSTSVYANSPALHHVKLQHDGGPTAAAAKTIVRYGSWRNIYASYRFIHQQQYVYWSDGSVTTRSRQIARPSWYPIG
jgi:hypothetical protein